MRGHAWWVAALVVAASAVYGCGGAEPPARRTAVSDEAFEKVELDTRTSNACSPDVDFAKFRGLAIAMPKKVALGRVTTRVPVCGAYAFTAGEFAKLPEFPYGIAFLVRDLATNETFQGHFVSDEFEDDEDVPPPAPPADPARVLGGYFNVNLVPAWQAPRRPGKYRVVFTVNEWASAPVDFEVVK